MHHAGKTAVADAAAAAARADGIPVVRVSPHSMEAQLAQQPAAETCPQLVVVDDVDHGGDTAIDVVGALAAQPAPPPPSSPPP